MCLSLAIASLGFVIANLASVSSHVWMQQWEGQMHVDDAATWDAAHERLKLARRLNPLNAEYSADLGRLMEWQSWRYSPKSMESVEYRARANQYYEEAIHKRPSWGFAWAHYAENQLLSGNPGREFTQALEKAMLLAPWEPGVQRKVAWMGMATWEQLPVLVRGKVEDSIRRMVTLESELEELVRLAIQYDLLDRLKPMMRTNRQKTAVNRVLKQLGQR